MIPVSAYFDGSYVPPPCGIACGGWVIRSHPDVAGHEERNLAGSRCYGERIVDLAVAERAVAEAECAAALDALQAIADTGYRGHVVLYGDSEQLVRELAGRSRPTIRNLDDLRRARTAFAGVEMVWVPREENKDAHRLARRALNDALIVQYGGRVEEFRLVRTRSGLYIHRYIVFPTPPVAVEAAGPIEEMLVLDAGRPRTGWNTLDLVWGGLKAAASQRARTHKTILSVVTPDGMIVGLEVENWLKRTAPQKTQNANDHWHRHAVRDTTYGQAID